MDKAVFLGFIVSAQDMEVEEKERAIIKWPTPTSITEVRSFHGLVSFYKRFVKDFSIMAAPLTEVIKKSVGFKWGKAQDDAFIKIGYVLHLYWHYLTLTKRLKLSVMC